MELRYLHLLPKQTPPVLKVRPFRAVIVADAPVGETWRNQIAAWIVKSGCLYVVAWGIDCETWHNSVDLALLDSFTFCDIPTDHLIITTWHDDESLSEALFFVEQCAFHPDVELTETIIVHVAVQARALQLLQIYKDSQVLKDGNHS